jgi:hypothetical protein
LQIIDLKDLQGRSSTRYVAFGQVVGVHIDDRFIKDGRLDTAAMQPIARCGYADYSVMDKVFAMAPKVPSQAGRRRMTPAVGASAGGGVLASSPFLFTISA